MKWQITYCFCLIHLFGATLLSQEADTKVQEYKNLLKSKEQIMAGITLGISPANFVKSDYRIGNFKNITYNSQWFTFTYGMGNVLHLDGNNRIDTSALKEVTLGANFSLKKLAVGKRLYDMRGMLLVPSIGAAVGSRTLVGKSSFIGKISPAVSLQFPFFAVDLKLHAAFDINKSLIGVKSFSLIPEIGIKIDGLYNLMDAHRVHIGHAEGTITTKSTSESTTSHVEGNYVITTTYRTTTTTVMPYSFDRNATIIGPLAAFGPHFSFQNQGYAGPTRMYGFGYYLRLGILSSDFIVDKGKIGFGSSMKEVQTVEDPSPQIFSGLNKEDLSNRGYYNATRFQARVGIDLYEIYMSLFGSDVAVGRDQGKFTRIIGGLGYGYAFVSEPHYISSDGLSRADDRFKSDYTMFTSSGNHAKFGKDGAYASSYFSLEAGAIKLTFEATRYFRANLASTKSITVGYLFPYNRVKKKLKAIKSYKNYIRENS